MSLLDSFINFCQVTVLNRINNASPRSQRAVKNIILSFAAKFISILSSLLIVPLTINYINPTQYGIWLTLSSIIGWIAFFDLGLGNGFRNKFAEARAIGNDILAREYLSTTYFIVSIIVLVVFILILISNNYINWSRFLNVDTSYNVELHNIINILSAFFCLNMVVNIFGTMLTADQKPGFSSMIAGFGQFFSLIVVFILTKTTKGSLTNLAIFFAGIPCLIMLFSSIFAFFFTSYRKFFPRFSMVKLSLVRDVLSIGFQFFIIYLCLIAIFQIVNLVITREIGPEGVTQYNIAKRYYNILYMVLFIILTPIWSAFTEAYVKKDFAWMRSVLRKFEKIWLFSVGIALIMLVVSPIFYKIWIGDSVKIPVSLTIVVMIFILCQSLGAIYMHMINGIGFVRIQTVSYIIIAFLAWPLMVLGAKFFGTEGIVLVPAIAYIVQAVICKMQINKIMSGQAFGIWIK